MKNKKIGFLNPYNLKKEDGKLLPLVYSTRCVLVTEDNKIILIRNNSGIHTLPGGALEIDEEIINGLIRECKEETGFDIKEIIPIGYIELWRKSYRRIVYGFIAKTTGKASSLKLEKEEIEEGHEIFEYSIKETFDILENNKTKDKHLGSIRSLMFLKEAEKYLENILK